MSQGTYLIRAVTAMCTDARRLWRNARSLGRGSQRGNKQVRRQRTSTIPHGEPGSTDGDSGATAAQKTKPTLAGLLPASSVRANVEIVPSRASSIRSGSCIETSRE